MVATVHIVSMCNTILWVSLTFHSLQMRKWSHREVTIHHGYKWDMETAELLPGQSYKTQTPVNQFKILPAFKLHLFYIFVIVYT